MPTYGYSGLHWVDPETRTRLLMQVLEQTDRPVYDGGEVRLSRAHHAIWLANQLRHSYYPVRAQHARVVLDAMGASSEDTEQSLCSEDEDGALDQAPSNDRLRILVLVCPGVPCMLSEGDGGRDFADSPAAQALERLMEPDALGKLVASAMNPLPTASPTMPKRLSMTPMRGSAHENSAVKTKHIVAAKTKEPNRGCKSTRSMRSLSRTSGPTPAP